MCRQLRRMRVQGLNRVRMRGLLRCRGRLLLQILLRSRQRARLGARLRPQCSPPKAHRRENPKGGFPHAKFPDRFPQMKQAIDARAHHDSSHDNRDSHREHGEECHNDEADSSTYRYGAIQNPASCRCGARSARRFATVRNEREHGSSDPHGQLRREAAWVRGSHSCKCARDRSDWREDGMERVVQDWDHVGEDLHDQEHKESGANGPMPEPLCHG
mmetsp:Transcript_38087/g.104841  ORF Transcript_38087/g.104841 Transcript_38087/m.104841 type:complete len:216 (-) Transcript_38087:433-1080(-)